MVDTTTIVLTAVCTGIGISMGNALYDIFLKDYFSKLKQTNKKIIRRIHKVKRPWLSALLNFFIWGLGYLYNGKKQVFGVILILIQIIMGGLSLRGASVNGSFEVLNYALFAFIIGAFLAYDGFRSAKEINAERN